MFTCASTKPHLTKTMTHDRWLPHQSVQSHHYHYYYDHMILLLWDHNCLQCRERLRDDWKEKKKRNKQITIRIQIEKLLLLLWLYLSNWSFLMIVSSRTSLEHVWDAMHVYNVSVCIVSIKNGQRDARDDRK